MSVKTVLLVGTSHEFQIPGNSGAETFHNYLRNVCAKFAISGVGEEMNLQALAEKNASQSVCEELAKELRIAHRYSDPDTTIRAERGILQENYICVVGRMFNKSPDEIKSEIRQSYEKRECYWCEEILDLDRWPLLFICGANHVENFSDLLRARAITVNVIEADWAPD